MAVSPKERIKELQEIQMQITRIIDEAITQDEYDEMVYFLREAFSNLNDAKGQVLKVAREAGLVTVKHPAQTEES